MRPQTQYNCDMCQMPTASRADCTQVDLEQEFEFVYDGTAFSAKLMRINIDFNACQGIDRLGRQDNNDLWSYANRLYMDGKFTADHLMSLSKKLVGDEVRSMCRYAEYQLMNEKGYILGYTVDTDNWTNVAGREALAPDVLFGKLSFTELVPADGSFILERLCARCVLSHRHIFYKRKTRVPSSVDLLQNLKYSTSLTKGNEYGVDFELYSSYEDAVNEVNPWVCPDAGYKYNAGFPGDCGPTGPVQNQRSLWHRSNTQINVAYQVNIPTTFTAVPSVNIGGYRGRASGSTQRKGDVIYMTSGAYDIWDKYDQLEFLYDRYTGDVELSVKIEAVDATHDWTKSGLMVRESLDPGARHYSVLFTPKKSAFSQFRAETNERSWVNGHTDEVSSSIWLKLSKRGSLFTGYESTDGEEWIPVGVSRTMDFDPATMVAGLALSSHHSRGVLAEVAFSNYVNYAYEWPSMAPSVSNAPSTVDVNSVDVGDVNDAFPGSATHSEGVSRYTIKGSGRDIWNKVDGFHFIPFRAQGDFVVSAFVHELVADHEWAKVGLVVRSSNDGAAPSVAMLLSKRHGICGIIRPAYRVNSQTRGVNHESTPSGWVRIERSGDSFKGWRRLTEEDDWQLVVDEQIAMNDPVEVGIAISSHNNVAYASAIVSDFELIETNPYHWPSAAPSATAGPSATHVNSLDIGSVNRNLPGMVTYTASSGVYTVSAAGSDIWGSFDGFHFIPTRVQGNFIVTVFIESFQMANYWSKAGVMVRDSLDPDAPNVHAYLNRNVGLMTTSRPNYGSNTAQAGRLTALESGWVRIKREGNTFSCFRKSDVGDWRLFKQWQVVMNDPVEVGLAVTAKNNKQYANATFSNFVIEAEDEYFWPSASPTATPGPTTDEVNALDIGVVNPEFPGHVTHSASADEYIMTASGADIWNRYDGFTFVPFRAQGDFTAEVFVSDLEAVHTWTKAGIMVRDSLGPESKNVFVFMTQAGLMGTYREIDGEITQIRGRQSIPTTSGYVKIRREGDTFTMMRSRSGARWAEFFTIEIAMRDPVEVGIALCSRDKNRYAKAKFSNFVLEAEDEYHHPSAAPTGSAAPSSTFVNSLDIGTVRPSFPGSATHAPNSNRYTITASGKDVWYRFDGFHFIPFRAQGDFIAKVFVESLSAPRYWTKAGLMVRDSLDPSSANVFALMNLNRGVMATYRATYMDSTSVTADRRDETSSAWLKIEREGNVFKLSQSIDDDHWFEFASLTVAMTDPVEVGMALTARSTSDYATATFTDFELDAETPYLWPSAAPSASNAPTTYNVPIVDIRVHQDYPGKVSYAENGNVYVLTAAGKDIWSNADSFSFVPEAVTGDFEVSVQVESLDRVEEWTKGGIMVRDGLDGNSKNVFLQLATAKGIFLTYRAAVGDISHSKQIPNTAQERGWMRIKREGNVFTCYRSLDLEAWEAMQPVTIEMSETVQVGMALTSHHATTYATAVFTDYEVVQA